MGSGNGRILFFIVRPDTPQRHWHSSREVWTNEHTFWGILDSKAQWRFAGFCYVTWRDTRQDPKLDNLVVYSRKIEEFMALLGDPTPGNLTWITAPYWFVLSLSMTASVPFGLFIFRHCHRRFSGKCQACGYDLQASTNACPECGTPIPASHNHAIKSAGESSGDPVSVE